MPDVIAVCAALLVIGLAIGAAVLLSGSCHASFGREDEDGFHEEPDPTHPVP
jgi:hypothetical protein